MGHDVAEQLTLRLGQHQIVEGRGGLQALRQVVQAAPGGVPAGFPHAQARITCAACAGFLIGERPPSGRGDRHGIEVELGDHPVQGPVERAGAAISPEHCHPQVPLLRRRRLGGIHRQAWPRPEARTIRGGHGRRG